MCCWTILVLGGHQYGTVICKLYILGSEQHLSSLLSYGRLHNCLNWLCVTNPLWPPEGFAVKTGTWPSVLPHYHKVMSAAESKASYRVLNCTSFQVALMHCHLWHWPGTMERVHPHRSPRYRTPPDQDRLRLVNCSCCNGGLV